MDAQVLWKKIKKIYERKIAWNNAFMMRGNACYKLYKIKVQLHKSKLEIKWVLLEMRKYCFFILNFLSSLIDLG